MSRWVFLADPTAYGWDDLVREGRAVWDGVANAIAQRNLRTCQPGDDVLIYHTAPDKAIQGLARVVVDVAPVRRLARPLPLGEIRQDTTLAGMKFVRMPRVAVQPVTDAEWQRVLEASGTPARRG